MHATLVVVKAEAAEVIPAGVAPLNVAVHAVGEPPEPSDACAPDPAVPQYPAAMPVQNVFEAWFAGTEAAVVPAGHLNHLPLTVVCTQVPPAGTVVPPVPGLVPVLQASIPVLPAVAE